jgi:hypothetical protein
MIARFSNYKCGVINGRGRLVYVRVKAEDDSAVKVLFCSEALIKKRKLYR